MIIAGNSHVTALKGCRLVARPDEPVGVHWVGALEVEHFFNGHPGADKVRRLFGDHDGWKLLLFGTHDVFTLLKRVHAGGKIDGERARILERYRELFTELARAGRFAWCTGLPQTRIGLGIPGLEPDHIAAAAAELGGEIKSWCRSAGIPVVDPLSRIVDGDGHLDESLLMADKLHLRRDAAHIYFDEIAAVVGDQLVAAPDAPTALLRFEPRTEPESFAALVLEELDLPARRGPGLGAAELATRLASVVAGRVRERGVELTVEVDTDFVADGLVDSLDLVEIYTAAVELVGIDVPFEVDLRQLATARRLADHLLASAEDEQVLTSDDFLVSLRGRLDDDPVALLAAEQRIAWMGAERYARLNQELASIGGFDLYYGVVHYWLALAEHALGHVEQALDRLAHAQSSSLVFPFVDERAALRRQLWLRGFELDAPARIAVTAGAHDELVAALAANSASSAEAPVLRVVRDAPPRALLDSLRGVDLVVGTGAPAAMARALGLPALPRLDADLVAPTLAWCRRSDWGHIPLPVPTSGRGAWVVSGSAWAPALLSLIDAAPGERAALIIVARAGAAGSIYASVAAVCESVGVEPDIVIVDESETSPVACFRAATAAWCDPNDRSGRALAALLELAPLNAHHPLEVLHG